MEMTTPTLPELLDKLKAGPEWTYEYVVNEERKDIITEHNLTRARLLAVVDALEYACGEIKLGYDAQNRLRNITTKLATALEEEK